MEGCRQTVWVALSMPSEKKKIPLRDSPETSRTAGGSSSKEEGEMKIDHFFAMELSRSLKDHPQLRLRMGIDSGPVSGVIDVTGRTNLAGAGLNVAQRVLECGDAGHILLSKHVAEDLEEYDEWRPRLHDLGTCEVKHGVRIGVANLYDNAVGNPQLPNKLRVIQKQRARVRWAQVA